MYSSYSGYGSNSAMNSLLRSSSSASNGNSVWIIISAVIAVIGGIVLYFTFLSKQNENNAKNKKIEENKNENKIIEYKQIKNE